jgi:hypothetical protein
MKVLIGTYEIAGWIQHYKNGFEKNGHTVTTAVSQKNPFYHCEYTYILNELFFNNADKQKLYSNQMIQRAIRKIKNKWINYKYERFIKDLIDQHDVLFLLWHPFFTNSKELAYARIKNKKIVSIFVGSDVRYFKAFKQEFNVCNWVFPTSWDHDDPSYHLQLIRNAEKYSDLIYSVPDQAGLQLKPYRHLQVPIDTQKFIFRIPENKIPKVVHAPSVPFKKGTDIIESILNRLKQEGIAFELITVRDMPNYELLQLLTEADVLVDEIVYNGPGALSFEGMLTGCAVATRYIESSPSVFRPPVWSINADNIYEKLKRLLSDAPLRKQLAEDGRAYALANNTAEHVVSGILRDLESPRQPNYYPTFLREQFQPSTSSELQTINEWTKFVNDCDWYQQTVPSGERAGLIF